MEALQLKIAESEKEFKAIIDANAVNVYFATPREESEYEAMDMRLSQTIESMLRSRFDRGEGAHYHQIFDWSPTKTRFIEVDADCISVEFALALQRLLVDDFQTWRINVHVYSSISVAESRHIGGMNVYSDCVLVERGVYELLARQPFNPIAPSDELQGQDGP